MSNNEPIYCEQQGPLGWIIFNRPDKRNAFSRSMWSQFPRLLEQLESDPSIRVILLRGVDDSCFSSGMDIEELKALRNSDDLEASPLKPTTVAFDALIKCTKPTVAMIQGECMGGGCAIALSCDVRTASPESTFAMTPARMGLGYPMKGVERAVQELGASNARYLFVTAKKIDAEHACRIGLVHELHSHDTLELATIELGQTIASNAPKSIRAISKMIQQTTLPPKERNKGAIRQWIADCTNSADFEEGMSAFVEKRPPEFKDR